MRAPTEAPDSVREAVPRRLRELGMTLAARGFKVIVDADRWCLTAVKRLCPAAAIAEATERISRVLALRDEPAGGDE